LPFFLIYAITTIAREYKTMTPLAALNTSSPMTTVIFSPDDQMIFLATDDNRIHIFQNPIVSSRAANGEHHR
jgi:hypothetical protein